MNNFKDAMSKRTDHELFRIVTVERKDYQPLAVTAAEEEIKNRNLDISRIDDINLLIANEHEKQRQLKLKQAGKVTRLLNFVIDGVVIAAITSLIMVLFNMGDQPFVLQLTFVFVFIAYYALMEIKFQKTVGKFITKTKVITIDEQKPKAVLIIRRTVFRIIPFDQISYLFTINGFHDRFSGTTVIKN